MQKREEEPVGKEHSRVCLPAFQLSLPNSSVLPPPWFSSRAAPAAGGATQAVIRELKGDRQEGLTAEQQMETMIN